MTVTMVTKNERLAHYESQIVEAFHKIGNALSAIRNEKLYLAAGYDNFDEYVLKRWNRSGSWARQMITAGDTFEHVAAESGVELISARHARELIQFSPDLRPLIAQTAYARAASENRTPTTSDIKTLGTIMSELVSTGHVDTGDGSMSSIDAAVINEDYERLMRQREHIRNNRPQAYQTRLTADTSGTIALALPDEYKGQELVVYVQLANADRVAHNKALLNA